MVRFHELFNLGSCNAAKMYPLARPFLPFPYTDNFSINNHFFSLSLMLQKHTVKKINGEYVNSPNAKSVCLMSYATDK